MARTKNRFNAVQIPEPVTAGVPVKQRKSFRVALYARLSVELKSRPSESSQPVEHFKRIYQE